MKKNNPLYLLFILLLIACNSEDTQKTTLHTNIKGLEDETLYIYGMDRYYDRVDTLHLIDGKLSVDLPVDTLVMLSMLLPSGESFPLFIDKGDKLTIEGTVSDSIALTISGNPLNDEYRQFKLDLASEGLSSEKLIQSKAAAYIHSHPFSLVSIYLLKHYFVETPTPDIKRIQKLIEGMSGELKDRPYIIALDEQLNQEALVEVGKLAPYFRVKDQDGTIITRTKFNKHYLLINFWASWDEASCHANQILKRIHKKYKKRKNFALLSISLDIDKQAWKEMIVSDTLAWDHGVDEKSWQSEIVKQYAITQLPTNVLLNTAGRIEKINITEDELEAFLKEVDEKEAARKKNRK